MTTAERNSIVEQNLAAIWWTINRNRLLLTAARLDPEDVFQQLALRLICAVDRYDPQKGDLNQHIFAQLRYELLSCKAASAISGISCAPYHARNLTVSLQSMEDGGWQFDEKGASA